MQTECKVQKYFSYSVVHFVRQSFALPYRSGKLTRHISHIARSAFYLTLVTLLRGDIIVRFLNHPRYLQI